MSFSKDKHDIGILRQDGSTKIGMMLAKKNDVPIYSVIDDEYLAQQFLSGVPGYGGLPPEKELALRQDDWRSGFGLEVYDSAEPKRYYSSIGMDLRFRGMAILGPKATAVTVPAWSAHWQSPTNYDDPDTKWDSETLAYDEDQGTAAVTALTITGWSTFVEFYIAPIQCSQIRYDVYQGEANQVDVDLYYDGAWQHLYEGTDISDGFHTKTIGSTKVVSKARVRVHMDAGYKARIYEFDFYTVATSKISVFAKFNNELYAAQDISLLKLNATGTAFTALKDDFPGPITDLETFTDGKLYIALGQSPYYEMTTAEGFTPNTASGTNTLQFLKTVHTTSPTMYGNDSVNTILSNTKPSEAEANAWGSSKTVGSSYHPILGLYSKSGALYIRKEDMPYYYDSSGNVQNDLAPELEYLESKAGDKNIDIWLNSIFMPAGPALLEHDVDGNNAWLSPSLWCNNLSEFDGDIQAVAHDDQWLFVAIDDGSTNIQILAGRRETIDGTTSWVWHPICQQALTGCETMFVSSDAGWTSHNKRLWIASTTAGENLFYVPLYANYGDVTSDANRSYNTTGTWYFETPWLHGNFRGDKKAYIKLISELGHTYNAGRYFEAWYKVFGGGYVKIDDVAGSTDSMVVEDFIDTTNKPSEIMMRLKFIGKTDSATITPILKSYDVRAILYPTRRDIIVCQVRCADGTLDKQGHNLDADAATIKTALEEAKNTATWPVTFYDIDGNSKAVRFLSASPFSQVIRDEKSRNIERRFNLVLQEVSLE